MRRSTRVIACLFILLVIVGLLSDERGKIKEAQAAQGQVQQQGELNDWVNGASWVDTWGPDPVSYVVPAGWNKRQVPGDYFAMLNRKDSDGSLFLWIFLPQRMKTTTNVFRAMWDLHMVPLSDARQPDWGTDKHTSISGYSGTYGNSVSPDGFFVGLYVLDADKSVPIGFMTRTEKLYIRYRDLIRKFVDRVRLYPAKAQQPKTSLTISDLVGEWTSDYASVTNYYNSRGGSETVSTVVGKGYKIMSDGRYTFVSAGARNEQYSRTETSGRVEFINNEIVFRENGGRSPSRYRFIEYETSPLGVTLLTLLPAVYEPTQSATPQYEVFARAPEKN